MRSRPGSTTRARVRVLQGDSEEWRPDSVVTEEPLEIRIEAAGRTTPVAVTMRTPGDDFALATGLLFSEGVISGRDDLAEIRYCVEGDQLYNVVSVAVRTAPDLSSMERRGTMTSACGVCGKTSLEALQVRGIDPVPAGGSIERAVLYALPDRLREAQKTFAKTGGLHGAALFTAKGELIGVREDVGRHNAVDKLIGQLILDGVEPDPDRILLVSGRAGYEILQKAAVAGIGVVASVSAPSSLAVELAREFGITLVGFLRGSRANVYSGAGRIR
ncbi:MAG TPA: formate dehydrogenase accessory sulfurtransferase FdhD [Mycobacteriales bacterium]|nr:formate dehydrogenase accessory sulfurtransferase FdhD [Mycobacteriales bacterium]